MAKNNDTGAQGEANGATIDNDTITQTIAGIDVALPVRFRVGHTLTETEAKVIDAAYRRQYKNNKDAAFAAWEKKVKDKGADEAGANPCDAASLLKDYADYAPNVGREGQTSLEKLRWEAGLLTLRDLIDEHNADITRQIGEKVEAVKGLYFGNTFAKMPVGKGSAEQKDVLVQKVLAASKFTDRVQAHIDALTAEAKASKGTPEASAISVDALSF